MSSSAWRNCATISRKTASLASRMLPHFLLDFSKKLTSQRHQVPPLNFPEVPSRVPELLELGLKKDHMNILCDQFINAVRKADEHLSRIYYASAPQLCEDTNSLIAPSAWIEALQQHLLLLRTETIKKLRRTLLSEAQRFMQEARAIDPSTSAISLSSSSKRKRQGRPSTFTPEQTFALNALLARDNQFSSEDKDFISQKLNLTRDQVNRWFCNARARKKGGRLPLRGESPASIRTVSSDLAITESNQTDQGATTPEVTDSTPDFNPTAGTTPGLTNSTTGLNNPYINPTLGVDSLDSYLDYSKCLEPEQSWSNLPQCIPNQHNQITSWCENVNMLPALSSFSSVESLDADRRLPTEASLCPEPLDRSGGLTSFNYTYSDPLDSNTIQRPFPSTSESPLPSEVLDDFDLSQW